MENNIEIYEKVLKIVDESINHAIANKDKVKADDELSNALILLNKYKDDINKAILDLRETSEWDRFTISMYGETNAGKSTLIETLRIFFGEEEKIATQNKFRKLSETINIGPLDFEVLAHEIKKNAEDINSEEATLNKLIQQKTMAEEVEERNIEVLKGELGEKKKGLSLLKKLLHIFVKLDEEKQLNNKINLLAQVKSDNKIEIEKQHYVIQEIKIQLIDNNQELNRLKETISLLAPYEDGAIIGNGRSDFTMQAQTYQFEVNNQKFDIIDVPGIEGDENKVNNTINHSVKKSHVVFYITRKPSPPNKGDDGQLGTLQKIKKHLGDQTEVWSVYNKSITNPIALQGQHLINEGELVSLKDMAKVLKEQLGDAYQGSLCVSALPAFYATSECLIPTSTHKKNQMKFLKSVEAKDILRKSNFSSFARFISLDICRNFKEKINSANRKKIRTIIEIGVQLLDQMTGTFTEADKNLDCQFKASTREIDNLEDSIKRRMASCTRDSLDKIKSTLRQSIYNRIESGLNNDKFKSVMEDYIKSMQSKLVEDIQQGIHGELENYESDLKEVVTRFQKNTEEIIEFNINRHFGDSPEKINLEFEITNGINTVGLLTSLGGASMLVWASFFASNPIGLSIAVALGAVTLIFSFYKSVFGFFSSSFKMEQQRKSTNKNIDLVFNNIEKAINRKTSEIMQEISDKTKSLKIKLGTPHKAVRNMIGSLKIASVEIGDIVKQLG